MKYVIAPDSFKESMTAAEAAAAISAGIRRADPIANCVAVPMSDGGEGFTAAVAVAWQADLVTIDAVDALGRELRAEYAISGDRAVMEMASTAGLELIAPEERDVLSSTTTGVGLMIKDAVERGVKQLLIGIGGSATNDAGAGMLVALGAKLSDASGREVPPFPLELGKVASIDTTAVSELLAGVDVLVACDVTNPLCGPNGATVVFGPQKGVTRTMLPPLDHALGQFATAAGELELAQRPGSGAAGGLGFALLAFLGAELRPGVELVAEAVGLAETISDADLVFTGEGSVDEQTLAGKTPAGVAALAQQAGVPCIVLAGRVKPGAEVLLQHGATELVQIVSEEVPLTDALRDGPKNLALAAESVVAQLAR